MAVKPLILTADTSEVENWIIQLQRLSEIAPEAAKGIFESLLNGSLAFSELFSVDLVSRPAAGTSENRIIFKMTPFLTGYMAALVAVERQFHVVVE